MIHFRTHGGGPSPVLVLPGVPGDDQTFVPTLPYLDTSQFTYVFANYRGSGGSRDLPGAFSLPELIDDLLQLVDHLGWSRFHLVGHSFGALVGQRLLIDQPGRLDRFVAVTPVPASGIPVDAAGLAGILEVVGNDDSFRAAARLLTGNRMPAAWVERILRHSRDALNPVAFARYLNLAGHADFSDRLMGNPCPMLILVGEHDPVYSKTAIEATMMQWLPCARLQAIGNCGHFPMEETPPLFAALVDSFLGASR